MTDNTEALLNEDSRGVPTDLPGSGYPVAPLPVDASAAGVPDAETLPQDTALDAPVSALGPYAAEADTAASDAAPGGGGASGW